MTKPEKIVIIGLEGLNPDLVYKWKDELFNLSKIMQEGIYGEIESTIPPLPAPAWSCILCGKNPGHFGFWDSTYRKEYSYGQPEVVNSKVINGRVSTLYKILPEYGKKIAIVDVPFTYPAPKISGGYSISGSDKEFTFAASLKEEIKRIVGEYITDISTSGIDFEQVDKDKLLKRIHDMDRQRFDLIKHFIEDKGCDFILAVAQGTDKVARLFYRYFDENHPKYTPNTKYKDAIKNHCSYCPKQLQYPKARWKD